MDNTKKKIQNIFDQFKKDILKDWKKQFKEIWKKEYSPKEKAEIGFDFAFARWTQNQIKEITAQEAARELALHASAGQVCKNESPVFYDRGLEEFFL